MPELSLAKIAGQQNTGESVRAMEYDHALLHSHTTGHECEHGITTVRRFTHVHENGHDPHGHESAETITSMHWDESPANQPADDIARL